MHEHRLSHVREIYFHIHTRFGLLHDTQYRRGLTDQNVTWMVGSIGSLHVGGVRGVVAIRFRRVTEFLTSHRRVDVCGLIAVRRRPGDRLTIPRLTCASITRIEFVERLTNGNDNGANRRRWRHAAAFPRTTRTCKHDGNIMMNMRFIFSNARIYRLSMF